MLVPIKVLQQDERQPAADIWVEMETNTKEVDLDKKHPSQIDAEISCAKSHSTFFHLLNKHGVMIG